MPRQPLPRRGPHYLSSQTRHPDVVTIIDYGIGNLRSIEKAFEHVGAEVLRTDRPEDLEQAERLVLPGVGAFGACIGEIRQRGLEAPIHAAVERGIPFLGVCIGLQLLFEESEERGLHEGLGLLPGRVVRFDEDALRRDGEPPLKIPHMGWNTVHLTHDAPLLAGLDEKPYFYFVHSYHAVPDEPSDVLASTHYGADVPAIVGRNNVFGVQFHPEKSQRDGLTILRNFSTMRL